MEKKMKFYKVSESDLECMIAAQLKLKALGAWGVVNWQGYGENFNEFLDDMVKEIKGIKAFEKEDEEDLSYLDGEDISFSDLANELIKINYEEA